MVNHPPRGPRRRPAQNKPPAAAEAGEGRARGEAVVRAVLEATIDELASVGLAALSIERVAERAGVNKTTIYRRYPTKEDLIVAAMRLQTEGIGTPPDLGNLHDDLVELLVRAARFMSEPRGKSIFRMLMSERQSEEVNAIAERTRRNGEHGPRILLQRAIARGELEPDCDLRLLLLAIIGPLVHSVFIDNDSFERADAEKLANIVLQGVLTKKSRGAHRRPS